MFGKRRHRMNDKKRGLTGIVGMTRVIDDPDYLEAYSRDHSFAMPISPWFVVKPKSVDEVQEIVMWANQTQTPLVPVSSGPPHFYGDTVPSATGAVMVDLSVMNKIIRIDRRNRIAVIEPGVTYPQLQPELARAGLRLSTPLLPRSNKSVVASLLERQPTLVTKYQWAILDPLRCIEVIWGDGQRMTTGDAAMQDSLEEAWKRKLTQTDPRGPAQTDFYKLVSAAQGSMGIVTWASLKCEVLPEIHRLFFLASKRLEDLIDFTYRLLRLRFGDELLLLNGTYLASIMGEGSEQITTLMEQFPAWLVLVGISGRDRLPGERVEFQKKDITDIAQQFGLQLLPAIPGAGAGEVLEAILESSREPYWKLGYKGECQDIFFLTTLERTPEFVKTMSSVAEKYHYPNSEIGVYIQPVHQGASCHCEFSLPFDRDSHREATRIREIYTQASEDLLRNGAYYSRPYGIWSDMVYNRDAQTRSLLKKIKSIFDPNNVMNPGKLCF
jgi:FAD/FMN-containing dehydrogenase